MNQSAEAIRLDVERGTWDFEALAHTLGAHPETIEDVAFGAGLRFTLGAAGTPIVDVYRDADALQVRTPDTEVTLHRLAPPIITPRQVVFERQEADRLRHVSLTGTGEVTLLSVPVALAAAEADEEAYLRSLEQAERPGTVDAYGFDDAEMRRLLDEGFGQGLDTFLSPEPTVQHDRKRSRDAHRLTD
jgi:hypothetical protein